MRPEVQSGKASIWLLSQTTDLSSASERRSASLQCIAYLHSGDYRLVGYETATITA